MSLSERIANIEKVNLRLKIALTVGSVLFSCFIAMGAAQKPPTKLRADRLELVDSQGTVRAVLQVREEPDASYTELSFFDSAGEVRRLSLIASDAEGFVEVTQLKND